MGHEEGAGGRGRWVGQMGGAGEVRQVGGAGWRGRRKGSGRCCVKDVRNDVRVEELGSEGRLKGKK